MSNYIYGAGGHGKVVLDAMERSGVECSGFLDDAEDINQFIGLPVIKPLELKNLGLVSLHIAIGNNKVREKLVGLLGQVNYLTVFHPATVVSFRASIGDGCFLSAHAVIAPDALVGQHCIVNHNATVDHDCILGDFSHVAPHGVLGGGAKIGRGVLVGSGAVVLPGISVGDYAIIGAGAIVNKNVDSGVKVAGNPARVI